MIGSTKRGIWVNRLSNIFTDSPFFVLNQLEAWGEPVRASQDVVAPRLKLRDFNFTSLTDAV
jgi:hypothetical protein